MSEIAKILTDKGVCEYKPPNDRRIYSRGLILSLKEQQVNTFNTVLLLIVYFIMNSCISSSEFTLNCVCFAISFSCCINGNIHIGYFHL